MGIDKNRFLVDPTDIDNSDQTYSEPAPYTERVDNSSAPSRVIKGRAVSGAAQTDSTWQIWREDVVGQTTEKEYAEVASVPDPDFVHQWSNRAALFPSLAFENSFSIQMVDAANSHLLVPNNASIDLSLNTDAMSWCCWVKSKKTAAQTYFMKTSASNGNNGYTIEMDSSERVIVEIRGVGTGDRIRVRTDSITADLDDGAWHFICVTKASGSAAASTVNVYVDGNTAETLNVLNDTLTGATTNTAQVNIGASFNQGTPRFEGNMDEAAIWNAELTSGEVGEIYNSNNGVIDLANGSGQISSALVCWIRMGDGSFTALPTIPDDSGNSNDATAGSNVVTGDLETETPP